MTDSEWMRHKVLMWLGEWKDKLPEGAKESLLSLINNESDIIGKVIPPKYEQSDTFNWSPNE